MTIDRRVEVREVGPRDGLQSIVQTVPTSSKVEMIDLLAQAGLRRIEAASFVSARAVPQMADAAEVLASIARPGGSRFEVLVPTSAHAARAMDSAPDCLVFVLATSETFNERNVRRDIEASLADLVRTCTIAAAEGVPVQVSLATSFGCPFEGRIQVERSIDVGRRTLEAGASELTFADTTGMANPMQVEAFVDRARWELGSDVELGWHFHNTRGMGLANVLAAVHAGAERIDSSIGGIGGCPFAPKASGNVCTEDVVHMLEEIGCDTGLDIHALIDASRQIEELLRIRFPGQVMRAGPVSVDR